MKEIQLLVVLFTLAFVDVFGQKRNDIPRVELVDQELIAEIKNAVKEELSLNQHTESGFFTNGKGYIVLEIQNYYLSDTLNRYFIYPHQSPVEVENLPNAYAFVENRAVLIYYTNSAKVYKPSYSAKSVKDFNKMIDRYLVEPKHIKARDESGKVVINDKNFRESFISFGPTRVLLTFRYKAPELAIWKDGEPMPH